MKKTKRLITLLFASSLLFCVIPTPAFAADENLAELTPPPPEKSWLDNILAGGITMIPLGLLSVGAVGRGRFGGRRRSPERGPRFGYVFFSAIRHCRRELRQKGTNRR